ncbi:MAG: AgmX/PglI C-terminal domain-containing protein [Minicystis sp.]
MLIAGAVGLFMWKQRSSTPPITQQSAAVTASAAPKKEDPPPSLYAPPPPPKLDDEPDAGAAANKPVTKSASSGTPSSGGGPCGGTCNGETTGALSSALRARAQSAQGCYQRALRTSEVSGSLTVSVQVGPSGQVCSASLANDTVHSSEIASCVLGRFRGQSFPPPSGGCIVANIPISFTIKQ